MENKKEKCNSIIVTHFINPQLFWYQRLDARDENLEWIDQLEQKLTELNKNSNRFPTKYIPIVGDKVSVHFLAWKKFIRAEVMYTSSKDECIAWALDYGFPFSTKYAYVHHLEFAYRKRIDHVRRAGLGNILAAELEYDFMNSRSVVMRTEKWSQRACEGLEKLLNDAASVVFREKFSEDCGDREELHHWGELEIINHKGNKFKASDYLIAINCAQPSGQEFRILGRSLEAIQIPAWQTNRGSVKVIENVFNSSIVEDRRKNHLSHAESCDEFAKRKVEDWCARNTHTIGINTPEIEYSSVSDALDDIGFGESVSAVHENSSSELHKIIQMTEELTCATKSPNTPKSLQSGNRTENTKTNMNYDMHLSEDAIFALDRERDFCMSAPSEQSKDKEKLSSVSVISSSSGLSSRKKKLLEMRLKVANVEANASKLTTITADTHKASSIQYKSFHQSTLSNSEAQDAPLVNQTDDISCTQDTLSKSSTCSSRTSKLLEIRSKYSTPEEFSISREDNATKNGNLSKQGDNIKKICENEKPPASLKESVYREGASVISVSSSRISHLLSLRNRIKEGPGGSTQIGTKEVYPFFENLTKNPSEILEKQNFESPDSTASKNKYITSLEKDFKARNIVPAGFDIANLNRYKDEENHWHRKKTTRYDHVPHDEPTLNASNSSSSSVEFNKSLYSIDNNNCKDNGKDPKINQNFRHTRPHTDKNKNDRTTTITDLSLVENSANIVANISENSTVETDSERSDNNLSQLSSRSASITKTGDKTKKWRKLKSPTLQKDKLDAILQTAKWQKELGNVDILDLENCNHTVGSKLKELSTSISSDRTTFTDVSNCSELKSSGIIRKEQNEKSLELLKNKSTNLIYSAQSALLTKVDGERCFKLGTLDNLVLVHSKVPVQCIEKLSDVYLPDEIHDEMVNMRITKVFRIQAYGWPHLLRGNSLFVVNPSRSGKTWCYLPPICRLVSYRTQTNYLPDTFGPVAIILVPSSKHVEHIHKYCRRLLTRYKGKVSIVPSYGVRSAVEAKIQLLNGCGILVVTPANLLRLIQDNVQECLIDPARLLHLVIDDMDLMISRSRENFENAVHALYKLRKKAGIADSLHLVVTSRDWDPCMTRMICRSNQPLLLIGNYLEAAVYGKAKISIKLCASQRKISTIIDFIEKCPLHRSRLLIFCNQADDVDQLAKALTGAGFVCIAYSERSNANVRTVINEWTKIFASQVLICSDEVFPELHIQNVDFIIHYSMPISWTKFTMRFSAFAQTYENFVKQDFVSAAVEPNASKSKTCSLILLDEENNMQLPRLYDFMKKHNQLKFVHADILAVMKRVLLQREDARSFKEITLCPYLLEFGECDESHCYHRHNLTRFDVVTKSDDIPTAGDMRIHILEVFSPTHYTARLLQHKPQNSKQWSEVRRSSKAAVFAMQLNLHYSQDVHLTQHWPPQLNDLCVSKIRDTFQRVRIVEMLEFKGTHIIQKLKIVVKLIDFGGTKPIDSDELFVLEDGFKGFPEQAIDIRLLGVVPYDNERTWDSKTTKAVQNWIQRDIGKNDCVHVSIGFALARTIWVKNVIVMNQLPTLGQYVYHVNLKRSLYEKNFAQIDNKKKHNLLTLSEECGLLTTNTSDSDHADGDISSNSNNESFNSDTSNLIKFSSNEDNTVDSSNGKASVAIDNQTNKSFKSTTIAQYKDEENWDDETYTNEVVVPLLDEDGDATTSSVTEKWCTLPLHRIMAVEIGDENENGKWAEIYLQLVDDVHRQKCAELLQIINTHIAKVKELPEKNIKDADHLQPSDNCIVKYEGLYLRAKLIGIYGHKEQKESRVYRFFLCDYACYVTVKAADLYNDFLYETTREIVHFTPFQAVHCTLAGIKLDNFAGRHLVTKDYLYAYAVREYTAATDRTMPRKGLGFVLGPDLCLNSYEILIYECDNKFEFSTSVQLNKTLIEKNLANLNEATKHFLELDVAMDLAGFDIDDVEQLLTEPAEQQDTDVSNEKKGLVGFDELLQCIQRSLELDAADMCADDADFDKEKVLQTLSETRAICSAAMSKQKPNENFKIRDATEDSSEKVAKQSKGKVLPNHEATAETIKLVKTHKTTGETGDSAKAVTLPPPPPLVALHKRPKTTWYETDCVIFLCIYAPDVKDYYLKVTQHTVVFAAYMNGEQYVLVLNLLGTVEPEWVSHEVRGLNVVVRLVKSVFMKWPRLLQETTKYAWLTYNLNAITAQKTDHLLPQQQLLMAMDVVASTREDAVRYDSDSSDSSDDEKDVFQTYTPIVNNEDIHDPTAEL